MLIEVVVYGTPTRVRRSPLPDDYTFVAMFWADYAGYELEDFYATDSDGQFVEGLLWEDMSAAARKTVLKIAADAYAEGD